MNKLFFPSTLISIYKVKWLGQGLEWLGWTGLVACMRIMIVQNKNEEDHGKMAVMINCSWFVNFIVAFLLVYMDVCIIILYDLGSSVPGSIE